MTMQNEWGILYSAFKAGGDTYVRNMDNGYFINRIYASDD